MPTRNDLGHCVQIRVEHSANREAQSGRAVRSTICFGGSSIFFWTKTGVIS